MARSEMFRPIAPRSSRPFEPDCLPAGIMTVGARD